MADRTVVYRLRAEATQFQAQMAAASASTKKAATEMTTGASKASRALSVLDANAATAALAVGTTVVVAAANFEQAMSSVQAATHESAANMDALRDAAIKAGADTAFSASEAAAGIENLAKAGVSTQDILGGGLTGALDLAAAGQLGVADASEIAATALTQFKLSGEDVPHVADLLAAGAGKAQGEVSDLAQALNQSGLVASQMGISLEETTGTLSAFASAGLLGSDAGTSFKTMLLRLANPSKESAKLMQALGINAYDASGKFVGMTSIAGQLQTAFEGKTQAERDSALATIFGSDAIRAASVLYEQGADGIETWTNNVNDAGYAAETAAIQMDNLKGDVEALKGSLETAFIEGGTDNQSLLRGVTQLATGAVNLSTETSKAGGALGLFRDAASNAINPLGGLSDEMGWLGEKIGGTDESTKDLAKSTDEASTSTYQAAGGLDAAAVSAAGAGDAVQATADELKAMQDALDDARDAARESAGTFVNLGDSLNDSEKSLGDWITEMANSADALNNFTANSEKAADRGLRKGLIRALQDAGEEGALRMKQLANGTQDEINRANEAWNKGQKAIQRYTDATVKVPKALSTKLDLNGVPEAITNLDRIRNAMANIKDKTVTIRVTQSGTAAVTPGFGPDAKPSADGGTVPKTGKPYADRHLYLLADGEEVISNRHGQADRHRSLLKAINGGLADGGTARKGDKKKITREFGFSSSINTGRLEDKIADLTRRVEDQTAATEHDIATRDKWAEKMASVAEGTISGFKTGLFEKSGNPWESGAGGGAFANLTKDIAGLQERASLQTQLAGMGITGEALATLLTEGSNADLTSLIQSGQAQSTAALINQRAALQESVGAAGGYAAFGPQFDAANKAAEGSMRELQQLNAQSARLEARLASIESYMSTLGDDVGHATGFALTGAASNGQRKKNHQRGKRG